MVSCGGSDVVGEGGHREHVVALDELLDVGRLGGRRVLVVLDAEELDLAPVDPARLVEAVDAGIEAGGRAGEVEPRIDPADHDRSAASDAFVAAAALPDNAAVPAPTTVATEQHGHGGRRDAAPTVTDRVHAVHCPPFLVKPE